jgi:hypothetical protein
MGAFDREAPAGAEHHCGQFPRIDFGASLYQQRGGSDRTAASCEKRMPQLT